MLRISENAVDNIRLLEVVCSVHKSVFTQEFYFYVPRCSLHYMDRELVVERPDSVDLDYLDGGILVLTTHGAIERRTVTFRYDQLIAVEVVEDVGEEAGEV